MPDCHEYRMSCAYIERVLAFDLLLIDDRNEDLGNTERQDSAECRRRYTDYGKRVFVHANDAANHTAIVLIVRVPVRVREHDVRYAVPATFVGAMEEAPEIRLNSQHVEIIAGHLRRPRADGVFSRLESYQRYRETRQTIETSVALAQIEIVGIRFVHRMFIAVLNAI